MAFSAFSLISTIMPILVFAGFATVLGLLVARAVSGGRRWSQNNAAPVLSVQATLVAKRTNVSQMHHHSTDSLHDMGHSMASTTYYATFQVESGDRMEFCIQDTEYGMLVEGDSGKLTFQGTRYQGFVRVRAA